MSFPHPPAASQQQPNVYQFAAYLARGFECKYVVGVGKSAAENLIDFLPGFATVGLVHKANLPSYRERYPFGSWLSFDPENPGAVSLPKHMLQQAIVVCTDVLGQLESPHSLLQMVQTWLAHSPVCILTTADADVNENLRELAQLLEGETLNVEFMGRTEFEKTSTEKNHLVAVVTNPSILPSGKQPVLPTPAAFKVCAFMAAYNEEDIIVESIRKWTDQGVQVHILENWSTDGTFELIKQLEGELPVTVERFPGNGPSSYFDWGAMLRRFEELAYEIKADWFVRRGADEILRSPWRGRSYRDGLYLVDQAGYNCVDHTVINFHPVDEGFQAGDDHERYFCHYSFGTALSDFHQIKTWKNYGQSISMDDGGHDLGFEGRRIYPFKFLLKHYPLRSQLHGEQKVFNERKARWNPDERKMGWHVQYDQIKREHVFVRPRSELIEFDDEHFQTNFVIERLSGIADARRSRRRAGTQFISSRTQTAARPKGRATSTHHWLAPLEITKSLPSKDSADCLVHLSSSDVFRALHNFKRSGSTYLLANTFISLEKNTDVATGDWRRLNLQLPPFNFPEPLRLIDERCTHTGGIYIDKRLGLWALKDLPS